MNTMRRTGFARGPIRLGRHGRTTVYLLSAGLWLTGIAWLVFHHFLRQASDFGPTAHPLERWWLRMHGAFAFGTLWMIGLLSANHIVNGWMSGRRRWSGGIMLAAVAVMVVTGYLLYYSGGETLRSVSAYAHWGVGIAAPALFLFHRLAAVFQKREREFTADPRQSRAGDGGKKAALSHARLEVEEPTKREPRGQPIPGSQATWAQEESDA